MITTSGSRLLDEDAQQALIDKVFPYVDLITPNTFEAEALWGGQKIVSHADMRVAAQYLLGLLGERGSVMIKGGHANETSLASDYILSNAPYSIGEPRQCDSYGDGLWLQIPRIDTVHTHGTGCTLSSSIASAMALKSRKDGAYACMDIVDACCLAKSYVTAGIATSVPVGQGPGPVAHTSFEFDSRFYPIVSKTATPLEKPFRPLNPPDGDGDAPSLGRLLPIANSKEGIAKICRLAPQTLIQDVQLRLKDVTDQTEIHRTVKECQELCQAAQVRLWVNDYWQAAIEAGCFGVHVGQEDLHQCIQQGGLAQLQERGLALGISTHSFGELSAALAVRPSYISLGPIFATKSKTVNFSPQGLDVLSTWRRLVPSQIPLVVIGGIQDATVAKSVKGSGASCSAVIGAIMSLESDRDIIVAAQQLNEAMGYVG